MAQISLHRLALSLFRLRRFAWWQTWCEAKMLSKRCTALKFTPNRAAHPVSKVLASAMANGEENFGVSREDLYVYRIFADEAPTRKWRRFGARGRFKPWLRRSSHITVILREREAKVKERSYGS